MFRSSKKVFESAVLRAPDLQVRLLARDRGVDLATVQGTGPGGRILEEDVSG